MFVRSSRFPRFPIERTLFPQQDLRASGIFQIQFNTLKSVGNRPFFREQSNEETLKFVIGAFISIYKAYMYQSMRTISNWKLFALFAFSFFFRFQYLLSRMIYFSLFVTSTSNFFSLFRAFIIRLINICKTEIC